MKRRPPYKYRKTRGFAGWVVLTLDAFLGAVAAVAAAAAAMVATVDRLAPRPVRGVVANSAYSGEGGIVLGLILVVLGIGVGGVVGGLLAAGLYRIRPWREKLTVGWWYSLGILRGLIGMFFIILAFSFIPAEPRVVAATAVVVWTVCWIVGQAIYDSPSVNLDKLLASNTASAKAPPNKRV